MNKLTKKISTGLITLAVLGSMPAAFAMEYSDSGSPSLAGTTPTKISKEMKNQENKAEHKATGFSKTLTITAINGNSITATDKTGTAVTVDITNAKLVRRFGGASNIAEFHVGDKIEVRGTKSTDGLTITAKNVKDNSIQKLNGIINGKVASVSGSTIMVTTGKGETYTATTTSSTVLLSSNPKKFTISALSDIQAGDKIKVRGVKDANAKTIEATSLRIFRKVAPTTVAPVTPATGN